MFIYVHVHPHHTPMWTCPQTTQTQNKIKNLKGSETWNTFWFHSFLASLHHGHFHSLLRWPLNSPFVSATLGHLRHSFPIEQTVTIAFLEVSPMPLFWHLHFLETHDPSHTCPTILPTTPNYRQALWTSWQEYTNRRGLQARAAHGITGRGCLGKSSTKESMTMQEHRSGTTDGTDAGIWRKHARRIERVSMRWVGTFQN